MISLLNIILLELRLEVSVGNVEGELNKEEA
jgi:hypothetical protein